MKATTWSMRQRLLLALVALSAVALLANIIVINVVGELSEGWWWLAVPVGMLLVPLLGVVALIALVRERGRAGTLG